MRCCVIGGAGFIGRYLCEVLAESGREVLAIGRKPENSPCSRNTQYLSVDLTDTAKLRSALRECEEVVDLAYATVPKTSFSDPVFDLQSNLPRSVALMEELKNQ